MDESNGWSGLLSRAVRALRGVPKVRLAVIALLVSWMVAGAVSLYGLRKPKATFIPIPQVLAESQDDKDVTFFVASFPFVNNDIPFELYREGLKDDLVRLGRTKVWLSNSERGIDFKALPVSRIDLELETDDYPPASSLMIKLAGPKEALYCGDAEGYYRDTVWYWKDWETGELQPHERKPGAKEPCQYDTLRVQFADGRELSFYIGAVTVAPHFPDLDSYYHYAPLNYEPIPTKNAWGIVIRYLLGLLGVIAGPAFLGAVLQGRRNYSIGVFASILPFSLLHFTKDYFVVEEAARRIGVDIWTSMGPLLASNIGTFTAMWLFRRHQRTSGAPPTREG